MLSRCAESEAGCCYIAICFMEVRRNRFAKRGPWLDIVIALIRRDEKEMRGTEFYK